MLELFFLKNGQFCYSVLQWWCLGLNHAVFCSAVLSAVRLKISWANETSAFSFLLRRRGPFSEGYGAGICWRGRRCLCWVKPGEAREAWLLLEGVHLSVQGKMLREPQRVSLVCGLLNANKCTGQSTNRHAAQPHLLLRWVLNICYTAWVVYVSRALIVIFLVGKIGWKEV